VLRETEEPDSRTCVIYGLYDPRTDELRYVGKTLTHLMRLRYNSHIYDGRNAKTHKGRWIAQLLEQGLKPDMKVLHKDLPSDEWQDLERELIAKCRDTLTNQTDGGEGVPGGQLLRHSEESKRKMSEVRMGIPLSPEHREKVSRVNRQRAPWYKVYRPDGVEIVVQSLYHFCKNYPELDYSSLNRTAKGIYKQHRGWHAVRLPNGP
jgi:hypothetical protein